ncbi:MAG: AsmA-like C-terminal region-containing protein [Bacteroidia bacterium]|nr:AsmA-like C-terminal region-containing protein [Bacteroidia bacterium]
MKRLGKIIGITLLSILALLFVIPLAFSDKIEDAVKDIISDYTQEKVTVDWEDFSLSIFSSFPDLQAGLENLVVKSKGNFESDTLLYVGKFKADIDVWEAIGGKIKLNELTLDHPMVRGIIGTDSIANWDAFLTTDTTAIEEAPDTTSGGSLDLNLKRIAINNANIAYIDNTAPMAAYINGLNLELSGDFVQEVADLKLGLGIESLNFWMDKTALLKEVKVDFDADINADLANNKYTFAENTLTFAGIPLAFDGYVQLKDSSAIETDIKLQAKETQFSTIWKLIPEAYLKDVAGLQTKGAFELYAIAKGTYIDLENIPSLDVAFKINNASVKYPDLPKTLNNINVSVTANNPGGSADLTAVDINTFHFELGDNPFDATLNLVKPLSNPTFKAAVLGKIDLGSLQDALPLDSMSISGLIDANLNIATDMKAIETENYDKVVANGTLALNKFHFEGAALPTGMDVERAKLTFSPAELALNPLEVKVGKSDFDVNGTVKDYLPYVLKDGTIKGKLVLKSALIDANELMTLAGTDTTSVATAEAAQPVEVDSTAASVILVPKNINFAFNTDIKTILYDKLTMKNLHGNVSVKDGVADLSNLIFEMCDGTIGLNGMYNTANEEKPYINMKINLNEVDINKLTNSFSTIDSLLPIAKKAHGKVSIGFDIKADIDSTMSPVMSSVNGKGNFASQSIGLKESDFQKKIFAVTKNEKWNDLSLKDFSFKFEIKDGNIMVEPFKVKVFGKTATFGGTQGLDQKMDYLLSIPTEREEIAKLLNNTGISTNTWSKGDDINLGVNIKGTLTDPSVSLNLDEAKKAIVGEVKDKVVEKAKDAVVDKLKDNEQVKQAAEKLKENEQVQKAADQIKNIFKKKK